MIALSFVIPCYKCSETISIVVEQIVNEMGNYNEYTFEIILVNDFPEDNTFSVIRELCEKNRNIKALNFSQNFGQHAALLAGYRYSSGDIIISLDDDGETPVNECINLINKINDGYDVAFASYSSKTHSFFRILGSKVNQIMTEIFIDKPHNISVTSFFAIKRYIIEEMIQYDKPFPYIGGLIFRCTKNIVNVEMKQGARMNGKSGYTLKSLVKMLLNGFTAFSVKPLRIASIAGVASALMGFIFVIYTVVNKMIHPDVPMGYSSIMATLLIVAGIIMIILGLIGEYIGRIYICMNNSPQYVIKEKVNIEGVK